MSEIIVLTREEYIRDVYQAARDAVRLELGISKKNRLYTRTEAARELGCSKATISNMIDQGRLKTTTDGKFITDQEIQRYLNQ